MYMISDHIKGSVSTSKTVLPCRVMTVILFFECVIFGLFVTAVGSGQVSVCVRVKYLFQMKGAAKRYFVN